jgi:thioredoxin-dependent peroxiredoxin
MINFLKTFNIISIAFMTNLNSTPAGSLPVDEGLKKKKLTARSVAPSFSCKDIDGKTVKLQDFTGKKILLSFHRNVGCPICNLRFHELEQESEYFRKQGLIVISIYESSAENMTKYLTGLHPYSLMIPDPAEKLYNLFSLDKSTGKLIKGIFHGALRKAVLGNKLQNQPVKQDGNLNRIGADFLIDENGIIHTAYYGEHLGDHLPLNRIKEFAGL